ncbi:MAG: amidohydrolase, partial [Gemmatimonadota bacterium]|nr:amidohydrolase [Gemmatimonadota bacterium]
MTRSTVVRVFCAALPVLAAAPAPAGAQDARVDELVATVQDTIIRLREHIHQYPELGNREFNTAALVADHLRALGFDEVQTGV